MIDIKVTKKLRGQDGEFELVCKLDSNTHELISIFGPSGSGKSTLLKMIAGLEKPDSGRIVIGGEVWFDSSKNIDILPQRRHVGFVFQEYSLFPNMSVLENVMFAQEKSNRQGALELLELVELSNLTNTYPDKLSGGQKQRVAIARAIAREPQIMLLDEPFSALDSIVKNKLHEEVLRLKSSLNMPILFVSHDKEEVFRLSDKVAIIKNNTVEKMLPPEKAFFDSSLSSKFSFYGRVLSIKKVDIAYIAYLSVGTQIVQVLLSQDDLTELSVGDEVQVGAKAFNPIIRKVNN